MRGYVTVEQEYLSIFTFFFKGYVYEEKSR